MKASIRHSAIALAVMATLATIAGCAGTGGSTASQADYDKDAAAVMAASFREQGMVKTDRLTQDEIMVACSKFGHSLNDDLRERFQAAALAEVKWPSDGKFLGDWKEGEKIAQSGRGLTWSDKVGEANGGNCYNCHRITKKEISYGTIGPSLYQYGKVHGNTEATQKYVWAKIWNPNAYSACTNMPRFGAHGILDEKQIRHITALLLDPKSPVNAE
jgi:sulfur-oxidizing protein SoxX